MSIEQTLVCDNCSRVINAASTATLARKQAQEQQGYQRLANRDLCVDCVKEQYPNGVRRVARRS